MIRRLQANSTCNVRGPLVAMAVRNFIEHSFDPKKWRSTEKDEVKRQFQAGNKHHTKGIPLSSETAYYDARQTEERNMLQNDRFTDWYVIGVSGTLVAFLLVLLNGLLAYGSPNPSPKYTPYVLPDKPFGAPSTSDKVTEEVEEITPVRRGDLGAALKTKVAALQKSS